MTHNEGAKVLMLSYSVVSDSLQPRGLRSLSDSAACEILQARILEGCHFLLQGIFSTQGSNLHLLCLLHWQANSLPLCHLG